MLFGVFVIAWPISNKFSHRPTLNIIVAVLIYGIGIIGNKTLPNYFCVWTACQHVIYFELGILLYEIEESKVGNVIKENWLLWIGLNVALFLVHEVISRHGGLLFEALSYLIMIFMRVFGAIGAVTLFHFLAFITRVDEFLVFRKVSKYTMPMYLIHQQVIYFTVYLCNGKMNPYLHALVNFIVAITVSYCISQVLMKWKVTRLLIGEK